MTVLDAVPLDAITRDARDIRFGRSVLLAVAGLLFGLGWIVRKAFGVVWLAAAWSFAAVRLGWRAAKARPAREGP